MISEKIRYDGFWFYDALRGGAVLRYYRVMDHKLRTGSVGESPDLNKILDHAVATTEYYRNCQGYAALGDFPIIEKTGIRENNDRLMSSDYRGMRLHAMSTSGSSGERFIMLQNREKRNRVLAELIYFNERVGFRMGQRYVYLRIWFQHYAKSRLVRMAQNLIPCDCSDMSDRFLDTFFGMMRKDKKIKCLMGYVSALEAAADYLVRKGLDPADLGLNVVIAMSERLDPSMRNLFCNVFSCPVVSRYSNQENGLLAQQDAEGDDFILNTAHYHFETLCLDSDGPAPPGQPARLVVTDLYNRAMPMIRYDTGDVVIARHPGQDTSAGLVLSDVSGRQVDVVYDTRGNKINPHFVALTMRAFDRIPRYQFIQDGAASYTLNLENASDRYDDEEYRLAIRKMAGDDASVRIVYLPEIPKAPSGKIQKVLCLYRPESNPKEKDGNL